MRMPFGCAPKTVVLFPSAAVLWYETRVHVPTSCSLSVFCWATAWPGSKDRLNAVMTAMPRRLWLRVVFSLACRKIWNLAPKRLLDALPCKLGSSIGRGSRVRVFQVGGGERGD